MPTGHSSPIDPAAPPGVWRFVGRHVQREEVRRVLLDPASGGLLIRGPAGIGKSSLVAEVVRGEGRFSGAVLELQGLRTRSEVPFDCLARALPGLLADDEGSAAMLLGRGVTLIDQAGVDAIWVEDAADLDEQTALVLHFLASERRLPIIFTARTGDALPEPVVALRVSGTIGLLALGPLADPEVAELVEGAIGCQVDTPTLRRLTLMSEGSPLHLRELLRSVVAGGALRFDGGVAHWERPEGGAWALGGLVGERLRRLSRPAFRACGVLALADGMPRAALIDLVGSEAVAEAEHAEVIVAAAGSGLVLAHPVYREVTADGLSIDERTDLCGLLAQTFAADGPVPDPLRAIAFQTEAGERVDPHLLADAAAACLRRSQPVQAERLARRLVDDDPIEGQLALGEALLEQGRDREAVDAFGLAGDLAETTDQNVRASIGNQRAGRWLPSSPATDGEAGPAQALGDIDGVATELVVAWQIERAVGHGLELRIGEAVEALATLPADRAWSRDLRHRAADAWLTLARATGRCDDVCGQLASLQVDRRLQVLELQGDGAGMARHAAELRGSRVPGDPDSGPASSALEAQALADLFAGDARAAARGFREIAAAEGRRDGRRLRAVVAQFHLAEAAARSAQASAARDAADAAARWSAPGGLAEALARLAALWAGLAGDGPQATAPLGWDLCAELGELGAFALAAEAGWLAWRCAGGAGASGAFLRSLEQVQGPLWEAVSLHVRAEQLGDPAAMLDAASAFAGLGRWTEAAEAADGAAAGFAELGERRQAVVAARAADAHRARRPEAPALWPARPVELPALSEREVEVVVLVARGLSNRAIAERLVLSVRTVEGHVLRSSAKLGVTSRSELAAAWPLGSPRDDDMADGGAIG